MPKVLPGASDLQNLVGEIVVKPVEYSVADMVSHVFTVPVPAGTIVLGVGHEVKTAFSGGATPTVTIGDGTTADKFATSAEIVPGTVNTFALKVAAKKYNAVGSIKVTVHADVTAGAGKMYILMIDLNGNGRLPGI